MTVGIRAYGCAPFRSETDRAKPDVGVARLACISAPTRQVFQIAGYGYDRKHASRVTQAAEQSIFLAGGIGRPSTTLREQVAAVGQLAQEDAEMTTVAFIGLGRMGLPMATNLLKAGFHVVGCDLDQRRVAALVDRGASSARTPAEAAAQSDVTLSIVMNDANMLEVARGPSGVLAGAHPGHIFADLSTVSPSASAAAADAAAAQAVGYVCAKVAGSVGLAEGAGLTLFASGEVSSFERCRPIFGAVAAQVHHVGPGDAAAYLKLVHSLIVGVYSTMIGEALTFGQRGGLDLGTMIDILESGPLGSRQLSLKGPILKQRNFEAPPSDIDTAAKDVDLILDTARRNNLPLPLTSAIRQVMAIAQARGGGKRDIYSVVETFEAMAGLRA